MNSGYLFGKSSDDDRKSSKPFGVDVGGMCSLNQSINQSNVLIYSQHKYQIKSNQIKL